MFRSLIAAGATALLLAPAFGQAAAPTSTQLEQSGLTPPTVLSQGYAASGQDVLVTRLLGETVFSSIEDSAEEVGTITDMVVTSGVGISAVVLSVGGFLGVGEKDVAVDFAQLEWAERQDGSRRWVLATTAEALAAAPPFAWADSEALTGEAPLTPQEEEEQLVDGDPNATDIDPALTTDQAERPAITTPVDRTGFSDFDETGLSADDLRGIGVYGINDEQIGTIGDIVTNPDGSFDAIIVDVGGFLGLGAKPVAVGFDNLAFSADTFGNRYLFLNTTREQLETQPAYDPATYANERNSQRMVITP
ncbi:PRC-barrel domain-containing protein [Devosia oryziradicis]|uniref:PRC-barrel domain-containing protein n=1 Tax=Devosia oryziradicis TaxID=2801335 RepID=A0ABX7BZ78_9HYPH|nr:PRC-barrel domain-containing protein [Devosia oryziradicis]QQR37223.1 PRC-barrel domain-containing protein [Devosia oryziradicis]